MHLPPFKQSPSEQYLADRFISHRCPFQQCLSFKTISQLTPFFVVVTLTSVIWLTNALVSAFRTHAVASYARITRTTIYWNLAAKETVELKN